MVVEYNVKEVHYMNMNNCAVNCLTVFRMHTTTNYIINNMQHSVYTYFNSTDNSCITNPGSLSSHIYSIIKRQITVIT